MGRTNELYKFLCDQFNDSIVKKKNLVSIANSVKKDIKDLSDFEFLLYCEKLKEEIEEKHKSGQLIGIITSQSIGEQNTQQSLDAKGKQEKIARKKPSNFRMVEKLIDMSGWKFTPDIIYFNVENPLLYYYEIKQTLMSEVVVNKHVTSNFPDWLSKAEEFYGTCIDRSSPCLIFDLDMEKIKLRNLELWKIANILTDLTIKLNCKVFFSKKHGQILFGTYDPDIVIETVFNVCIGGIEGLTDIYINKQFYSEAVKETRVGNNVRCVWKKSWFQRKDVKRYLENKWGSTEWEKNTLKNVKEAKTTQTFEYFFEGSYKDPFKLKDRKETLIQILKKPFVDKQRTYTEHIQVILETQGKEAAQTFFEIELNKYTGNKLKTSIIQIISNAIFSRDIMKISRAGYKSRESMGWISKISFEESDNMIEECAFYGAYDNLISSLSSLAISQKPKINYRFK